jgi:hypothetical protein
MGSKWTLRRLPGGGGGGVDSPGKGQGLLAGSCEFGDKALGSGATGLVSLCYDHKILVKKPVNTTDFSELS